MALCVIEILEEEIESGRSISNKVESNMLPYGTPDVAGG